MSEIATLSATIERTLSDLNAPAHVLKVDTGPATYTFHLRPGNVTLRSGEQRRVRVSRIKGHASDLAAALGRRVSVEVNSGVLVHVERKGRETVGPLIANTHDLVVGLGLKTDGTPLRADITQWPHCLVAGATGSGKSVFLNSLICNLLLNNTPAELRMVMVDTKLVELSVYNSIPHLWGEVETTPECAAYALYLLLTEAELRYRLFEHARARDITEYNTNQRFLRHRLPRFLFVADELADLMMDNRIIESLLVRLAQKGRACGIHLVVATQRPGYKVVTGQIKANFPIRIAFRTASKIDSRIILDANGAESLLGTGDMLYRGPDGCLVRAQGCLTTPKQIETIIRMAKYKEI